VTAIDEADGALGVLGLGFDELGDHGALSRLGFDALLELVHLGLGLLGELLPPAGLFGGLALFFLAGGLEVFGLFLGRGGGAAGALELRAALLVVVALVVALALAGLVVALALALAGLVVALAAVAGALALAVPAGHRQDEAGAEAVDGGAGVEALEELVDA
jgi:hypothetical protein